MFKDLTSGLRPAIVLTLLFAVLLGLAYPAVLTGVGQVVFPKQANGSLIRQNGRVIGSEIIAQAFTSDRYFHPRPSAAGKGYEADNSYGSNLGPTSRSRAVGSILVKSMLDRRKSNFVSFVTSMICMKACVSCWFWAMT